MKVIFGIDYGSKFTGNTVIAILDHEQINFMQVDKNVDADQFIYNAAEHFKPELIFIDSPISLPGIYTKVEGCSNYHFRLADRELRAMSPMFLGGMVARAMELKDKLNALGCAVMETYPKVMALQLKLKACGYKGSSLALKDCKKTLAKHLEENHQVDFDQVSTWHHFDALLALLSAIRHIKGHSDVYGKAEEGQIVI